MKTATVVAIVAVGTFAVTTALPAHSSVADDDVLVQGEFSLLPAASSDSLLPAAPSENPIQVAPSDDPLHVVLPGVQPAPPPADLPTTPPSADAAFPSGPSQAPKCVGVTIKPGQDLRQFKKEIYTTREEK